MVGIIFILIDNNWIGAWLVGIYFYLFHLLAMWTFSSYIISQCHNFPVWVIEIWYLSDIDILRIKLVCICSMSRNMPWHLDSSQWMEWGVAMWFLLVGYEGCGCPWFLKKKTWQNCFRLGPKHCSLLLAKTNDLVS